MEERDEIFFTTFDPPSREILRGIDPKGPQSKFYCGQSFLQKSSHTGGTLYTTPNGLIFKPATSEGRMNQGIFDALGRRRQTMQSWVRRPPQRRRGVRPAAVARPCTTDRFVVAVRCHPSQPLAGHPVGVRVRACARGCVCVRGCV